MARLIAKASDKTPDEEYPKLMISTYSGSVYLMTSQTSGTKVSQGESGINSRYPVGTHKSHWAGYKSMSDYCGHVTLSSNP